MKNNLLSKLLTGALLLVVFLFCFSKTQTAYAITYEVEGNNSAEEAMSIELNVPIEGAIGNENDEDWYSFYVRDNGALSFSISFNEDDKYFKAYNLSLSDKTGITVCFYEADLSHNNLQRNYFYFSSKDNGIIKLGEMTEIVGIRGGSYYVCVRSGACNEYVPYRLTVSVEDYDNWEEENNNEKRSANHIEVNKEYYGTLMSFSDSDWYRFTIEEDGYVRLVFPYHEFFYDIPASVRLYGPDGYTKIGGWDIKEPEGNEYYSTEYLGVSAGDYYLCIVPDEREKWEKYWDQDRVYRFKVINNTSSVWESERNDSLEEADYIKTDSFIFGTIQDRNDVDWYCIEKLANAEYIIRFEHPEIQDDSNLWIIESFYYPYWNFYKKEYISGSHPVTDIKLDYTDKGLCYLRVLPDQNKYSSEVYNITVIAKKSEEMSVEKETHSFGSWVITKEATCTSEGQKKRTCTECGFTDVVNIEKKEHVHGARTIVEKPTCEKNGLAEIRCAICGEFYKYDSIPRVEHKPEMKIVKEPSCSEKGKREWICSMCGKKMGSEVIAKTPHRHEKWITVKEPACEEEGLRRLICEDCNEVLREEKTEGLQHNYGAIRKARGNLFHAPIVYEQECSICGKVIRTEVWDYKWIPDAVYIGSTALLMVTGALIAVLVSVKEREKVRKKAVTKK